MSPMPSLTQSFWVVLLVGVVVSGSPRAMADEAAGLDPAIVPYDTPFAAYLRPTQIMKRQQALRPLAELMFEESPFAGSQLKLNDLEILGLVRHPWSDFLWQDPEDYQALIVRTHQPYDWSKHPPQLLQHLEFYEADPNFRFAEEEDQVDAFFEGTTSFAYLQLDERTVLIGRTSVLDWLAFRLKNNQGERSWQRLWDKVHDGDLVVVGDGPKWSQNIREGLDHSPPNFAAILGMADPLWRRTNAFAGKVIAGPTMGLRMHAETYSANDAELVAETLQAMYRLGRNAAEATIRQAERNRPHRPDDTGAGVMATAMVRTLLDGVKIETRDVNVSVSYDLPLPVNWLLTLLQPAIEQAREQAQRSRQANKMRQILLAMMNYETHHGRFPAPVLLGPDGKTPHSWRVALLPYLGHQELYDRYRFDEPWDSEANRQITDQVLPVYSGLDPNSNHTTCFVLVGPQTGFPLNQRGMRSAEFLDGQHSTIMLVEAQREIPWAQPEDIAYDANGPLPKLGGVFHDGFLVCLFDGQQMFVPNAFNETLFRAMVTPRGGEIVEPHMLMVPDFRQGAAAENLGDDL